MDTGHSVTALSRKEYYQLLIPILSFLLASPFVTYCVILQTFLEVRDPICRFSFPEFHLFSYNLSRSVTAINIYIDDYNVVAYWSKGSEFDFRPCSGFFLVENYATYCVFLCFIVFCASSVL